MCKDVYGILMSERSSLQDSILCVCVCVCVCVLGGGRAECRAWELSQFTTPGTALSPHLKADVAKSCKV